MEPAHVVAVKGDKLPPPERVWVVISPRGAIHAASLIYEPIQSVPGKAISWLEFPCMGGPLRSPRDMAVFSADRREALEAAWFVGSRGMLCGRPWCRRKHSEGS